MKRIRKWIPVLLSFFTGLSAISAQQASQKERIEAILDTVRQKYDLPGITASVIFKDGKVLDIAKGYSDSAAKTPMTVQTRILGGSTGKMYFAVSILKLADQHQLSLDDLVSKYLGTYSWYQRIPNAEKITIRQLLNHTAGIEEYYVRDSFPQRLVREADRVWTHEDLLSYVFDVKPLFEPGTSFSYADTHYLLLEMIINKITGKTAYDFIQKNIISKAKLAVTIPSVKRVIPGLANGYSNPRLPTKIDGAMIRNGRLILNPQFEGGGGGYATSSHDLATLVYTLMSGKLLSDKWLTEMKTPVLAQSLGRNQYYGLGLQITQSPADTSYGHSGWFPGYVSDVEYFPAYGFTIAVQFNTDMSPKGFIQPKDVVWRIKNAIK